jgi:hypothetical protein
MHANTNETTRWTKKDVIGLLGGYHSPGPGAMHRDGKRTVFVAFDPTAKRVFANSYQNDSAVAHAREVTAHTGRPTEVWADRPGQEPECVLRYEAR